MKKAIVSPGIIEQFDQDIQDTNQIVSNVATVVTGNTNNSGHTISNGEYFIANGAKYKATATIGTGEAWATNAQSVSDHDLINALNSKLSPVAGTMTPTSIVTSHTYNRIAKVGRLVVLSLNFPISGASGQNATLFTNVTLPDTTYELILANSSNSFRATVKTDGTISVDGDAPADGWYAGTLTYISAQ